MFAEPKHNAMTAQVKTKSNYRNLNYQFLPVFEIVGTRVTCIVEIEGREQKVDFSLTEILSFN